MGDEAELAEKAQSPTILLGYDEIWQNQRWQPGFGFCAPMVSSSHFTDFTGENHMISQGQGPPDLPLQPGWEWISEWEVATNGAYEGSGSCDSEGWVYAGTFERLLESIRTKKTSGVRQTTSVVRRRRWIRQRKCVNPSAIELHQTKIDALLINRARLESALHTKYTDVEHIVAYEKIRRRLFQDTVTTSYQSLLEAPQILSRCIRKLQSLEQFLTDRVLMDREYAKRLKDISIQFSNHDDPSAATSSDIFASASEGMFPAAKSPMNAAVSVAEAAVNSSSKGFFSMVGLSEEVISKKLMGFTGLVSDSLSQDVGSLLADLNKTRRNVRELLLKRKDEYCPSEEHVMKYSEAVVAAFHKTRIHIFEEIHHLDGQLSALGVNTASHSEQLVTYENVSLEPRVATSSKHSIEEHSNIKKQHDDGDQSVSINSNNSSNNNKDMKDVKKEYEREKDKEIDSDNKDKRRLSLWDNNYLSSSSTSDKNSSLKIQDSNSNKNREKEKEKGLDMTNQEDVWLRIQRYRQEVAIAKIEVKQIVILSLREKNKLDVLLNRVRMLFVATVQLFAFQQAYTEAAEFLSKIGKDIVSSGGPSATTYDDKGQAGINPVNARTSLSLEELENVKHTQMLMIDYQLPRFPESYSVVYHGVVRIASSEEVRRANVIESAPAPSSSSSSSSAFASLNISMGGINKGLGSFAAGTMNVFSKSTANRDTRERSSTAASNSGSSSMNYDDTTSISSSATATATSTSSAVHWIAAKGVVTADGMLHFFQFRIDAEEWMSANREKGLETITIGHGLVLIKSMCIKDCHISSLSYGDAYKTAFEIRPTQPVVNTGGTIMSMLSKSEVEGTVMLLRDENEMNGWHEVLCDPLPLLPSPQYTGIYSNSTLKQPLTPSLDVDANGNGGMGGVGGGRSTTSVISDACVSQSTKSEDHEHEHEHEEVSVDHDIVSVDSGFDTGGDGGVIRGGGGGNSAKLRSPPKQSTLRKSPQRSQRKQRSFFPQLPPSKEADQIWIRRKNDTSDGLDAASFFGDESTRTSYPIFLRKTPKHSMLELTPPPPTRSTESDTESVDSHGGDVLHSYHPVTGRPMKYRPPPQIIPERDANAPLALKQSDTIRLYEMGLQQEKEKRTNKFKETKEKVLSEFVPGTVQQQKASKTSKPKKRASLAVDVRGVRTQEDEISGDETSAGDGGSSGGGTNIRCASMPHISTTSTMFFSPDESPGIDSGNGNDGSGSNNVDEYTGTETITMTSSITGDTLCTEEESTPHTDDIEEEEEVRQYQCQPPPLVEGGDKEVLKNKNKPEEEEVEDKRIAKTDFTLETNETTENEQLSRGSDGVGGGDSSAVMAKKDEQPEISHASTDEGQITTSSSSSAAAIVLSPDVHVDEMA